MKPTWLNTISVICILVGFVGADWVEDLKNGQMVNIGDGVKIRVDKREDSVNHTSYFSSHVLRVFLWNISLTIAKAAGKDGLQIGLLTNNNEARGPTTVFSVFLPLLIGFKIAGSILTTLVAVLIVSLKAFLASKVALLLSGSIVLKKMFMHDTHTDVHYPVEYYPHSAPYQEHDYPSSEGYSAPDHNTDTSESEPTAHEAADSKISEQFAYGVVNSTTSPAHRTAAKRRIFRRKNAIVPIFAVHKITRHHVN